MHSLLLALLLASPDPLASLLPKLAEEDCNDFRGEFWKQVGVEQPCQVVKGVAAEGVPAALATLSAKYGLDPPSARLLLEATLTLSVRSQRWENGAEV